MVISKASDRVERAILHLPRALRREIERLGSNRVGGLSEIREIRIRHGGRSTLQFKNDRLPLYTSVTREDMENILVSLCDGSLYAYRDTIADGYITLDGGVRVGLCGSIRYDGDGAVGVSDMGTFVFRIPGHECEFADELCRVFRSGVGTGIMIYSPPGVGKTTALRALARGLGSGREAMRVAVVDERREFAPEDYEGCEVDILQGYKKCCGMEIACRTLSPQVIMIDEVGADEAEGIHGASKCGIPIVATAHAGCLDELCARSSLSTLMDSGVFRVFVGISRFDGGYLLTVDRV